MSATPQVCKVEDCAIPVRCKGLCHLHYDRWLRSGKAQQVDFADCFAIYATGQLDFSTTKHT
jgi:hypothetical protein